MDHNVALSAIDAAGPNEEGSDRSIIALHFLRSFPRSAEPGFGKLRARRYVSELPGKFGEPRPKPEYFPGHFERPAFLCAA